MNNSLMSFLLPWLVTFLDRVSFRKMMPIQRLHYAQAKILLRSHIILEKWMKFADILRLKRFNNGAGKCARRQCFLNLVNDADDHCSPRAMRHAGDARHIFAVGVRLSTMDSVDAVQQFVTLPIAHQRSKTDRRMTHG